MSETISPDDYLNPGHVEIYATDINARIGQLAKAADASLADGDEPFDEEVREFEQLVQFRRGAEAETASAFGQLTIVPGDGLADFLREEALDNGEVSEDIARHVDWAAYAREIRPDFLEVPFGADTVLVRS